MRWFLFLAAAAARDPLEVLDAVAGKIMRSVAPNASKIFGEPAWSYGTGIIAVGMREASRVLAQGPLAAWTDELLDGFLPGGARAAEGFAAPLLKNETIPWGSAIGDVVPLFASAYLDRAERGGSAQDLAIAVAAATRYVLPWPTLWEDGAASRNRYTKGVNCSDNCGRWIWADDAFMGATLAARLARTPLDVPDDLRATLLAFAADQVLRIDGHLSAAAPAAPRKHGADARDGARSCCAWSRANGWLLMAKVEVLLAGPSPRVLASLLDHLAAMVATQSPDGRWHQIVDNATTFLETSGSAMAVYALATAIDRGWADAATFAPALRSAWAGLQRAIDASGVVTGICKGFGVHDDPGAYAAAATGFERSGPGLGAVLRAALAMRAVDL